VQLSLRTLGSLVDCILKVLLFAQVVAMAKRLHESGGRWRSSLMLFVLFFTCLASYLTFSPLFRDFSSSPTIYTRTMGYVTKETLDDVKGECCRGLEHTEFWSEAVNWGNDFLLNSSQMCCNACKKNNKCNSWVYCGDEVKCGTMYRQCWLKRQKDQFEPEIHDASPSVAWTSGLVFDPDSGIVELVTNSATVRMELLPDCAPNSVQYILELLKMGHCAGCRFYRAEGRGDLWDPEGNHIAKMSTGPPYAVIQGTLEVQYVPFKEIPRESQPAIKRGMVGWVGTGPDFFISLVDHDEWPHKHTVFATVLEADMALLEDIANLPTNRTSWMGVNVAVLLDPVSLKLQRPTTKV